MTFVHKELIDALAQQVGEAYDDKPLSETQACNRVRAWMNGQGQTHLTALAIIAVESVAEAYLNLQRKEG